MEDRLISFGTARLAKEKGCGLTSAWFYDLGNNNELRYGSTDGYGYQQFSKGLGLHATSQSLLQRWLREEYGVHIVLIPTVTCDWTFKIVTVLSKRDNDVIIGLKSVDDVPPYKGVSGEDFSTYMETI